MEQSACIRGEFVYLIEFHKCSEAKPSFPLFSKYRLRKMEDRPTWRGCFTRIVLVTWRQVSVELPGISLTSDVSDQIAYQHAVERSGCEGKQTDTVCLVLKG
jgi:hypothetical protein